MGDIFGTKSAARAQERAAGAQERTAQLSVEFQEKYLEKTLEFQREATDKELTFYREALDKGISAQEAAVQAGIKAAQEMEAKAQEYFQPFREAGIEATQELSRGLLKPVLPNVPDFQYDSADVTQSPEYQRRAKMIDKEYDNMAARIGGDEQFDLAAAKNEAKQALFDELEQKQYGRAVQGYGFDLNKAGILEARAGEEYAREYGRLSDLAKIGQGMAGAAGQGALGLGGQSAQMFSQAGGQALQGNLATGAGLAGAYGSAAQNVTGAYTGAAQNIGSIYGNLGRGLANTYMQGAQLQGDMMSGLGSLIGTALPFMGAGGALGGTIQGLFR